jgi:capsid protein
VILPNGSALPVTKADKFLSHSWQGRRWAWVDPLKDVEASVEAINNLLASPQQIAAQTGRDIVDVLDDLQRFEQLCKDRGIRRPTPKPSPSPAAQPDEAKAG